MALGLITGWASSKFLSFGFSKAKSLLSQSPVIECFDKACSVVAKRKDIHFSEDSLKALSSSEGISSEETLMFKIDHFFDDGRYPTVEELETMLLESWQARKAQLDPSEAADFFLLSLEQVKPVLSQISEQLFSELAQINELRSIFTVKQLQGIGDVDPSLSITTKYLSEFADQKIEEKVSRLRQSRFFPEYDRIDSALKLAKRLTEGDLSNGSDEVRSRALAWCARLLVYSDEQSKAEEYFDLAKSIGSYPEVDIAGAFISSQNADKEGSLKILAGIDSSLSRSAAFMIVGKHDGAEGAVDWLNKAGIDPMSLDSDGKQHLLMRQLELANWKAAREIYDTISTHDQSEAPFLHRVMGVTRLLDAVPLELRTLVCKQMPFDAANFPLASTIAGLESRRAAHSHFVEAVKVALELDCPHAALIDDDFALWLELKSQDNSEAGRQRLKDKLCDTKFALHLVPLALQFGVKLDLSKVERNIEQQIALHGAITYDAAIARFSLAFTQNSPENVANYIGRHYADLSKYLDGKAMRFLQIEQFILAGLPRKANECLDILLGEGIPKGEEERLRRTIDEVKDFNPIETKKEQFKSTDSLGDLAILVDELESKEKWEILCGYAEILFERTLAVRDAERLAEALTKAGKNSQLVNFLRSQNSFLSQSKLLQMFYCWALYHEGALLEARSELAKLSDGKENPNYRALQVNLGIYLGDWNSLSAVIGTEYQDRDKRSASELIVAAKLAFYLGSPLAKDLTIAATIKGDENADVLTAAYFLATSAGWDDDEVSQWIQKAAMFSGEDGPLQQMTLEDLLDRKPEWDRRESETWQLLRRGQLPMFLAGQSLNKTLIDLMLFPAFANLSESDPRRRGLIAAYSGKRQPLQFEKIGTVGMDSTALLTLSLLGLLDKGLDAFGVVWLPHSTLAWLFEEKQKISFHQPSRIRDAHHVRDLIATDMLEKITPSTIVDSELASQVGDELAILIAEAEKDRETDTSQRIVVRSSPVYRVTSLMKEEADLANYAGVMSSCLSIITKLREKGQITAEEEQRGFAYLQLQEKPWPNQPEINDGATLYLDGLAISYFSHLGVLEKLKLAGFKVIITQREVSEVNALISYSGITDKIHTAVEDIRSALNSRIESGKILVDRCFDTKKLKENSIAEHPTVAVIALSRNCDAIISDDRFLNQHTMIAESGHQSQLLTTLDLLDFLVSTGSITSNDQLECRTKLRRAGYLFIPIDANELTSLLYNSDIKDGKVIETAELKSIQESILHVRMSDWLQLPQEVFWLDMGLKILVQVLRELWVDGCDFSKSEAYSNWLMEQIDVRGWAHRFEVMQGDNLIKNGRGAHIMMLLRFHTEASLEVKKAYWHWLEDNVLNPIKEYHPNLFAWIIEWQQNMVSEMSKMELPKEE